MEALPARWLQEGVPQGKKQSPSYTSTNAEYCEGLIVLNGAGGWDSVSMAAEEVTHGTTINTNLPAKSTRVKSAFVLCLHNKLDTPLLPAFPGHPSG